MTGNLKQKRRNVSVGREEQDHSKGQLSRSPAAFMGTSWVGPPGSLSSFAAAAVCLFDMSTFEMDALVIKSLVSGTYNQKQLSGIYTVIQW